MLPVASLYARMFTRKLLRTTIEQADMMLKEVVLARFDALFDRFVINTNPR